MASKSEQDCETKVITVPEQLDYGKVTPRSAIHLVSLKLQATLEGFGFETIKGVARWNDQICVATNRFLVFFDDKDSNDESVGFMQDVETALPPEISPLVTISAHSKSKSLYILSDWIWTLSKKHKLTRWIEATNVSSVSVSEDGGVLLAGNTTLTIYDKDGAMLRKFSMPREYHDMEICQAELTGAETIVVSISGRDKGIVLLVNEEGIVKRMYDSSIGKTSGYQHCSIPNLFIALGKCGRLFVAETCTIAYNPLYYVCREKIVALDKDFQLNQIILPDMRPQFRNYSRICYNGNQLIVICKKVGHDEDTHSGNRVEILTPVVNVYKVENQSVSETDYEIENEDFKKSSEIPDNVLVGSYSTDQSLPYN